MTRALILGLMAVWVLRGFVRAAELVSPPAAAGGTVILSETSPWNWHMTFRKPLVTIESFKAAGISAAEAKAIEVVKLHGGRGTPDIQHLESLPPPADWIQPEFNDSDWPRARGPFHDPNVSVGTLCLRGRFRVTDPEAVRGIALDMRFRGGVIVYLNGREVARAHLSSGAVALDVDAEPYPNEAWVDAEGRMLPIPRHAKGDEVARIASRDRARGPVAIPATGLRKGMNVLAMEFHRSVYHPVAIGWWRGQNLVQGITKQWTPLAMMSVGLKVEGAGAEPNIQPPKGIQVWTADINTRVEDIGFGDPRDVLTPIRIMGARNGVYSGQAVISSDASIRQAKAIMGDLATAGGGGIIPASAVRVRYILESGLGAEQVSGGGASGLRFNALQEAPPAELKPVARRMGEMNPAGRVSWSRPVASLPILVTVRVPADAAAGEYQGLLKVSAEGLPETAVPVRLQVAGWSVPSPREFRTHVGLFQSPTTLALKYKTPEWSEEHWKLMEKSFTLLGEVGNNLLNVPLSDRTQFGNDEGMVYWVRQADGTYQHDYRVLERYLRLARKHLGVPRYIAFHVWHPGTWVGRKADEENTVTVVDKATGAREHVQVPVFGTDEAKAFWKPVLDGCRERLAKEGMGKSMALGILCDATAPPEVFKMFDEVAPGMGWTRGCHSVTFESKPYGLKGGGTCVYHEFCYGLSIADPGKQLPLIHAMTGPGTAWFRGEYDHRLPPFIYRTMTERGLYCRTRGVGRMGLDFWSVSIDMGKGKMKSYCLFNRWPHSSVAGHGDPTLSGLADAGPDGARPSLRFELFREGLQEAEAAIVLSEALQHAADKTGPELAARCKALLIERINVCRGTQGITEEFFGGWQDRSARLYAAAAEVTGKAGKGQSEPRP